MDSVDMRGGPVKKYIVERYETISRYYQVEIEAEHPDDAKEMLWDLIQSGLEPLRDKQMDSDTYVREKME